jgi:deoxycytidine triphosphate deaminase
MADTGREVNMILNDQEITDRIARDHLIVNHDPSEVQNCRYALRVGKVLEPGSGDELALSVKFKKGRLKRCWILKPTQTLVVCTKEFVHMPNDLCATYGPLFRLSKKGVMLLNASVVEPGYNGPLSCFLVNFSSTDVVLFPDDPVAKICFSMLRNVPINIKPQVISETQYIRNLTADARLYHDSFLDVSSIAREAAEEAAGAIKGWAWKAGLLLGILLTFATLEPLFSRILWERTGIVSASQRAIDVQLIDQIKRNGEIADLRAQVRDLQDMVKKITTSATPINSSNPVP